MAAEFFPTSTSSPAELIPILCTAKQSLSENACGDDNDEPVVLVPQFEKPVPGAKRREAMLVDRGAASIVDDVDLRRAASVRRQEMTVLGQRDAALARACAELRRATSSVSAPPPVSQETVATLLDDCGDRSVDKYVSSAEALSEAAARLASFAVTGDRERSVARHAFVLLSMLAWRGEEKHDIGILRILADPHSPPQNLKLRTPIFAGVCGAADCYGSNRAQKCYFRASDGMEFAQ